LALGKLGAEMIRHGKPKCWASPIDGRVEKFPLKKPFNITGYRMVDTEVVTVELEKTVTSAGAKPPVFTIENSMTRPAIRDRSMRTPLVSRSVSK